MHSERRDPAELVLPMDRGRAEPLPVQLATALRSAILSAQLLPGDDLPSSRALARSTGVARGVVVAAYEQLLAEGYLYAEAGRGTRVNPALAAREGAGQVMRESPSGAPFTGAPAIRASLAVPAVGAESTRASTLPPDPRGRTSRPPLSPGAGSSGALESSAWRSAWRTALEFADHAPHAFGESRLRAEIGDHLRRVRATPTASSDVLVTAGAREGLGLLLTALGTTRGNALVVGVEDPGYPSLRAVATRHGAQVVALPVDEQGLRVDRLPEGVLDLVIVTPSHQYPLGGSLPLPRRLELLEWARRSGVLVIEDDFDSEFRVSGSPLPMLAALDDPEQRCVITLGTFSSTVTPALAAGYLRAPEHVLRMLYPVRRDLGSPVAIAVQRALAEYLASGALRRNIARQRRRHARRRDLISDAFVGIPGLRPRPLSGGLHAVIELTRGAADALEVELVARANAPSAEFPQGLGVAALGSYWRHLASERMFGLVIGMGGTDDAVYADALRALRDRARGVVSPTDAEMGVASGARVF